MSYRQCDDKIFGQTPLTFFLMMLYNANVSVEMYLAEQARKCKEVAFA